METAASLALISARKNFWREDWGPGFAQAIFGKGGGKKLIAEILKWNIDKSIHGIIVQLPLPLRISKNRVLEAIDPWKDVDGMTAKNLKGLWAGDRNGLMPATTKGILALFDYYKIPIMGKKVVVVGRSLLVGKPVAMAFTNRHATVATVCHSRTKNLEEVTKKPIFSLWP